MKKIFLATLAIMATIVSCQKVSETDTIISNDGLNSITATIVSEETKTYFDGSEAGPKYRVYWNNGDVIRLFNTEGAYFDYRATGVEGKKTTAEFTAVGDAFTGTFACAYYPASTTIQSTTYQSSYNTETHKIIAPISGTQSGLANSVATGSYPMVGTGELNVGNNNLNLNFSALFSVLELDLTKTSADGVSQQAVSRITVESDNYCFGEATIDPSNYSVSFDNANCRGKNILLTHYYNLGASASSFYIAIPSGSHTFTVAIAASEQISEEYYYPLYIKKVGSAKTFSRGVIKNMSDLVLNDSNFSKVIYPGSLNASSFPSYIGGVIFAPVNAGFVKGGGIQERGKMFQWGRKSGAYLDGTGQTHVVNTKLSNPAEEDDNTFYYANASWNGHDWLETSDNTRWNLGNEDTPKKNTTYDPCPNGWRVPTYTEFATLIGHSTEIEQSSKYGSGHVFYGNNAYYTGSYVNLSTFATRWNASIGGSELSEEEAGAYHTRTNTSAIRFTTSTPGSTDGNCIRFNGTGGGFNQVSLNEAKCFATVIRCVSTINDPE